MTFAEQLAPPIAILLGLFLGFKVFAPAPAPAPEPTVLPACDIAELQTEVRALAIDVALLEAERNDGGWQ